jgi:hypothetical protein
MTDDGTATLVRALAGAQKLMVPRWLYDALKKNTGLAAADPFVGIHYAGGNLPLDVGEYLPEDVMVIQERSGGLKAVKLERAPKPEKEASSVSSTRRSTPGQE